MHILKTMEFVEQYLALPSVWSFEDKEGNLLTFEVIMTSSLILSLHNDVIMTSLVILLL